MELPVVKILQTGASCAMWLKEKLLSIPKPAPLFFGGLNRMHTVFNCLLHIVYMAVPGVLSHAYWSFGSRSHSSWSPHLYCSGSKGVIYTRLLWCTVWLATPQLTPAALCQWYGLFTDIVCSALYLHLKSGARHVAGAQQHG